MPSATRRHSATIAVSTGTRAMRRCTAGGHKKRDGEAALAASPFHIMSAWRALAASERASFISQRARLGSRVQTQRARRTEAEGDDGLAHEVGDRLVVHEVVRRPVLVDRQLRAGRI